MNEFPQARVRPRPASCKPCRAPLRLGGGEPLFGLEPFIGYPELFGGLLPGAAEDWYATDRGVRVTLFPFKTLAAAVGVALIPLVSRLTARWDPPRELRKVENEPEGSVTSEA